MIVQSALFICSCRLVLLGKDPHSCLTPARLHRPPVATTKTVSKKDLHVFTMERLLCSLRNTLEFLCFLQVEGRSERDIHLSAWYEH